MGPRPVALWFPPLPLLPPLVELTPNVQQSGLQREFVQFSDKLLLSIIPTLRTLRQDIHLR